MDKKTGRELQNAFLVYINKKSVENQALFKKIFFSINLNVSQYSKK